MSGFEVASVVLGVLPLLVNQLDNYAQGIEALKTFRTRRYRIEFKTYVSRIKTQRSIMLNALEKCLEDVVEYDEDVAELLSNPAGPLWKEHETKLRRKLGNDYDIITDNMADICRMMEALQNKLGLKPGTLTDTWSDSSTLEKELKKFRDIFSRSVYTDLITKLETATTALQTIADQVHHREIARTKRISKRPLARYRAARQSAKSLYNAIINGKCWKCPCKNQHAVYIRLDPDSDGSKYNDCANTSKFRIIIEEDTSGILRDWNELEVESEIVEHNPKPESKRRTTAVTGSRVQFALVAPALGALRLSNASPKSKNFPAISDMCSALSKACSDRAMGVIMEDKDPSYQHLLHFKERSSQCQGPRSLKDVLYVNYGQASLNNRETFSRLDRLRLAANLACSVLKFYGSWLKLDWEISDLLFRGQDPTTNSPQPPYLALPLSEHCSTSHCQSIQGHALLPLGLALIELSLGESLANTQIPEGNPIPASSRYVQRVYSESGYKYGEVVKKCLFWTETLQIDLDDGEFQQAMFTSVIRPLHEDLDAFTNGGKM